MIGQNEPRRLESRRPVHEVFDFDFTEQEVKMSGQTDLTFVAKEDGVLNCIVFWYKMALTADVSLDHTPEQLRESAAVRGDYNRHAYQWLPTPLQVSKGDEIDIRASYSRSRIRFEIMNKEIPKKPKGVGCPRWLFLRLWDEQRLEAFRKAIEKALEKIMEARDATPKLDRPPLRIVHMGAGLGQISMLTAKCAREAGITDEEIETHGSSVIALEQMPKVVKLARRLFRDNGLDRDVFLCSEDVRKLPSQPQRAQLVICEHFDPGLLGEGILVLLNAARIKMCNAFEHQVIPSRATIWAAAFEFGEQLRSYDGFDLSALNHYRTGLMTDLDTALADGSARQLSNVFEVFKFDFEKNLMPDAHSITFTPISTGKITAIVFWYEMHMDMEGDVILTNWPESIPPADFSMLEKDLHRVSPLRQAVCNFQGSYIQEVVKDEPIEIDVGYQQAWPQFIWPGTEMVQKESGERIPKPPPMPRHRLYFEKMKTETEKLEQQLQSGLMYDETQWSTVRVKGDGRGDGHAHVIGDVGTATVTVSQASQDAVHDRVHHVHHVTYSDDPPEHLHEYVVHDRVHHVHHVTHSDDPPEHRHEYATYADRVPGEAKPDWSHVYLSQQHLDPSKVPAEWMDDTGKDTQIIHDHHIIFDDLPAVHHVQHIVHHHYDQAQAPAPKYTCDGRETQFDDCPDQTRCVACTPVDCLFTEWSRWYDGAGCIGLRFRHRSIQVRNNECGLPCYGSKMESELLAEPKPECLKKQQDCVFSSWSQWSVCKSQVDQAIRERHIDREPLHNGEPCKGSSKETRPCGGPEPMPCILSDWHEWTPCSATCGEGRHARMRRVKNEDYLSGQTCDDALMETKECSVSSCPSQDCSISTWSEWSPCGRQSLQKTRNRVVLVSPEGSGMGCNVSLMEADACAPQAGEDCIVSEWSAWTHCDKSCHGGQTYRHRRLMRYNSFGGTCPTSSLKEVAPCNTQACVPVTRDCAFGDWGNWSTCSQETGEGFSKRLRSLVPATGDGKACNGTTVELKACQIKPQEVVDCKWGSWLDWSDCTKTCGGGSMRRSRAVEAAPRNGGLPCQAEDKEEVAFCSTMPCSGECIDGKWSDWADWGECSAYCGSGFQKRRRSLATLPTACGAMPEGHREDYRLCDPALPACEQDQNCRLSLWSSWSECSKDCHGVRERVRHITMFARGNGVPCVNESLKDIEDCNPLLGGAAPAACGTAPLQDCVLQDWSEWSDCSVTCGGGEQLRKRTVLQASSNGGRPCNGTLTLVQGCSPTPCHVHVAKDCKWGDWADWGDCTHCGGQRTRHRIIEQLPTLHGKLCDEEDAKEVSNCTSYCHDRKYCVWSEWSGRECAPTCGVSTTMRNRVLKLVDVADAKDSLFVGDKHSGCLGSQLDVTTCPSSSEHCTECVPVDCAFGPWSEWNEPTCVGLCERQRVVKQMSNECGSPCSGALQETKHCQSNSCDAPQDCEVSDWTEWSHCSNATGHMGGQRYRRRDVLQAPKRGGLACYGDLGQTKACKGELPEPCVMDQWQSWGDCSTTCGEGFRSRERTIKRLADDGGTQCNGRLSEVKECHAGFWEDCGLGSEQDCEFDAWNDWSDCSFSMQRERSRDFKKRALLGGLPCMGPMHELETCHHDPVDCTVSDWTDWDNCDRTCGSAHARRQREILTFPMHGGKFCPSDLVEMKACHLPTCDLKDCKVSGWLEWGACSASCGPGQQSRVRAVINLREPGGFGCFFSIAENQACQGSDGACSADCEWENWDDWSDCSQSCGGGHMKRERKIKTMPSEGGKACDNKDMTEMLPCNVGACHEHCVDGAWAVWEQWSPCSRTCGGGVTFRRREVKQMANSCGHPAIGHDKETKFCNVDVHCQKDKDCLYTGWSSWNECSSSCTGIRFRRRSIAAYGHGDGLFCQGALQEVSMCNPAEGEAAPSGCLEGPKVDCVLSAWSGWDACSATCDGGEQRRHRYVTQHPHHGGLACKGTLVDVRECGRDHCHNGGHPLDCVYGQWKEWAACGQCDGERKRVREILVYPAKGGRECVPAAMEEVGACPNPCASELACSWQSCSGHPDLCARPCVYIAKRGACNVDSCNFCHLGHDPDRPPAKLDQRSRQILSKLARGDVCALLLGIFRAKIEQMEQLRDTAAHILKLLEEEIAKYPPEGRLAGKRSQELRKFLGRMSLTYSMTYFSPNLPENLIVAFERMRQSYPSPQGADLSLREALVLFPPRMITAMRNDEDMDDLITEGAVWRVWVRVLIEKEGYTGYILQLFGILHPILCPGSGLAIHLRLVGATEAHDSPVNPVGTAVGIRRRSFAGATTAIIGAGWTRAGKRSKWSSCSATCGTGGRRHRFREMIKVTRPVNSGLAGKPHRDLIQKYRTLYDRTRSLEEGQMKEIGLAFLAGFLALSAVGTFVQRLRRPAIQVTMVDTEQALAGDEASDVEEEMLGDGYAAAERIALEPNGNPNYLIDPNNANFFHMMFFL
ncbi:adt-1 [Symbiodinium microadriaticum]|nr:adt-1 [Symbiodinium microadriaticum]